MVKRWSTLLTSAAEAGGVIPGSWLVQQQVLYCTAVCAAAVLTESTCMPHPAQEAFPQLLQTTFRHMVISGWSRSGVPVLVARVQ